MERLCFACFIDTKRFVDGHKMYFPTSRNCCYQNKLREKQEIISAFAKKLAEYTELGGKDRIIAAVCHLENCEFAATLPDEE